MAYRVHCNPNVIPEISETPLEVNTGSGDSSLSSHSFMSQNFVRQALLFYVEPEPRGISQVPNVESPVFYMKICNLSKPGFEPWTFGLAYLRANHAVTAALLDPIYCAV